MITNIDGIPTLEVSDANDIKDYTLIDVRRNDEYNAELGHISGALLRTLGAELSQYLSNTNKDEKILFICRSGMRSANATQEALNMGFKNVFNLKGGMMAWNERKFPVVRD